MPSESRPVDESTVAPPKAAADPDAAKIYLLPNLMTAGNLFCGFVAMIRCVQALFASQVGVVDFPETSAQSPEALYAQAVWFILAAVMFDSLDGRMARLTGKESAFGLEFDSLADVVSFGLAPALLVFFFLLNPGQDFPLVRTLGGFVGFAYLLCAAVRLARFNVLTSQPLAGKAALHPGDFRGLPVPAAAGMVASLVLMINEEIDRIPDLRFAALGLPFLLILISILMVSNIRYPSFKSIGANTHVGARTFIALLVLGSAIYLFDYYAISCLFLGYILFGIIRWLREMRKEAKAKIKAGPAKA